MKYKKTTWSELLKMADDVDFRIDYESGEVFYKPKPMQRVIDRAFKNWRMGVFGNHYNRHYSTEGNHHKYGERVL